MNVEKIREAFLKEGENGTIKAMESLAKIGYDEFDSEELLREWTEGDAEESDAPKPGSFEEHEQQRECITAAASGGDFAPENVRAVIGAPSNKTPLEERIAARKRRNAKIKEDLEYHDQEWTNDDGDPSAYEEWRADVNEENKKITKERDEEDAEREGKKTTHPDDAWSLNKQEDEFLNWFYNDKEEEKEEEDKEADFDETEWDDIFDEDMSDE